MYLSESTSLQLSNALSLIDLSQKLAEIHPLKVRYIRVLRVHFFTSYMPLKFEGLDEATCTETTGCFYRNDEGEHE